MANITIKSSYTGHFTIITNDFARNPDVTPRAARVFIYLMSNDEGWATSAARVASILGMGESTVGAALRDLEALGYLRRERKNVQGGRFKWEYELHATPITTSGNPSNGLTSDDAENPQVDTIGWKTTSGNPSDIRRSTSKKIKEEGGDAEGLVTGAAAPESPSPESSPPPPPAAAGATPDTWCTSEHPRCREHAHIPAGDEVPSCRQCGNVRKWFKDRAALAVDAKRRAIEDCPNCDNRGFIETADTTGRPVAAVCGHERPPQPVNGPEVHRPVSDASTRRRMIEELRRAR